MQGRFLPVRGGRGGAARSVSTITRRVLVEALRAMPAPLPRSGKKRPFVDTW